jgi:hypothetical protein
MLPTRAEKTTTLHCCFPIIRQVAHQGYLLLAKYRHPISQCLYERFGIGIKTCEQGTCNEKPSSNHNWGK